MARPEPMKATIRIDGGELRNVRSVACGVGDCLVLRLRLPSLYEHWYEFDADGLPEKKQGRHRVEIEMADGRRIGGDLEYRRDHDTGRWRFYDGGRLMKPLAEAL